MRQPFYTSPDRELHETKCKMIIVIIDACRNNPFEGKERAGALLI